VRHRKKTVASLAADWSHPTDIRFGIGRVAELAAVCWSLGITRPLLVTDQRLAAKPFFRRLADSLRGENLAPESFAELEGEPTGEVVSAGAWRFLQGGFNGIVAVGGGSALDAGKAVALSAAVGPSAIWGHRYGAAGAAWPPGAALAPLVAVPTTAGTGSEVDASAVITNTDRGAKLSLYHPGLLPKVVIADPELTKGMIPYLTAATGMDALSHNLEALCSQSFHPILDAVALQGVRYLHDWLPVAFHDGANLQARAYVMAASFMGAIAFDKGLGAMHGIAHAVGGMHKTQHGRTIAAVMPFVLRHNRKRIAAKMDELAAVLGLSPAGLDGVVDWIVDLRLELGLPASLSELGVKRADAPRLAALAMADGNTASNPAPLTEKSLERLIASALKPPRRAPGG
jgi:hypothetical protein